MVITHHSQAAGSEKLLRICKTFPSYGPSLGKLTLNRSGGVTTELLASDILDTEEFWDNELCRINQEFLFGCSTGLLDGGYGNREV